MVRLINVHKDLVDEDEILFMVDRTSPVGNPFHLTDERFRKQVCMDYERYFNDIINKASNQYVRTTEKEDRFINYLNRIISVAKHTNVALGCHCKPKLCHGETILKYINQFI